MDGLRCLYTPRSKNSDKDREVAVKLFEDRFNKTQEIDGGWDPVVIYAEGITSNNSIINKLRKGAFTNF
jgi:hypothetical protein